VGTAPLIIGGAALVFTTSSDELGSHWLPPLVLLFSGIPALVVLTHGSNEVTARNKRRGTEARMGLGESLLQHPPLGGAPQVASGPLGTVNHLRRAIEAGDLRKCEALVATLAPQPAVMASSEAAEAGEGGSTQPLLAEARTPKGHSLLHQAALKGNARIVELLLTHGGLAVNARTEKQFTPLHLACYAGQVEAAKVLLAAGADVGARTDAGAVPLQVAASAGFAALFEPLLREEGGSGDSA
jgi:hypothetical protein